MINKWRPIDNSVQLIFFYPEIHIELLKCKAVYTNNIILTKISGTVLARNAP